MAGVYRATDRMIAELVEAAEPAVVVVFSLGGMGVNGSDVPSMGLLPELLYRWATGSPGLVVPREWSDAPGEVPLARGGGRSGWQRAWFAGAGPETRRGARALVRAVPRPLRPPLRRARAALRRSPRDAPVAFENLDWHPATWYRSCWSGMRAFALPSFSPGRIRVNLRGRERTGLVDPADYDAVCDELERLVGACRDPRTGEPVVKVVERPGRTGDPLQLPASDADLVVAWQGSAVAFEHPEYGVVGPLPYRRTGGHTGPYGFAYVSGLGAAAGDHGVAATFDLAPTLASLVSDRPLDGISGSVLTLSAAGGESG
jgi:hypothetical protein